MLVYIAIAFLIAGLLCMPSLVKIYKVVKPQRSPRPPRTEREIEDRLIARGSRLERAIRRWTERGNKLNNFSINLMERVTGNRETAWFIPYVLVSCVFCLIWWYALHAEAGALWLVLQRWMGEDGITEKPTLAIMPQTLTGLVVISLMSFGAVSGILLMDTLNVINLLPFVHKNPITQGVSQIIATVGLIVIVGVGGFIGYQRMRMIQDSNINWVSQGEVFNTTAQHQIDTKDRGDGDKRELEHVRWVGAGVSALTTLIVAFTFSGVLVLMVAAVVLILQLYKLIAIDIQLCIATFLLNGINEKYARKNSNGPHPDGDVHPRGDDTSDDGNDWEDQSESSEETVDDESNHRHDRANDDPLGVDE